MQKRRAKTIAELAKEREAEAEREQERSAVKEAGVVVPPHVGQGRIVEPPPH